MNISFFGATKNVTGSKHLLDLDGFNLLLDCGFFQGRRSETNLKNKEFLFKAEEINSVILSHAHLDHSGALPLLVKNGFNGKIYCTPATKEIVKYILFDSAEIQKQDAIYFNKHIEKESDKIYPIYDKEDANNVLEKIITIPYFRENNEWCILNDNIRFRFLDAGHILGSAITELEIKENNNIKRLIYTGDLGREESPILKSPEFSENNIDFLISEATYGNKIHGTIKEAEEKLSEIVNLAISQKGKIIIPAFALGRTQEIIYILHKLTDKKLIPKIKIFIDSPMAINITELFSGKENDFDIEWWHDFGKKNIDIFTAENIYFTRQTKDSQEINNFNESLIVISASGMCEGGRILHHLKNNIEDGKNIILLTGYQAENTLGRKIKDNKKIVKIFGKEYNLKAKVFCLDELSAHADKDGLLQYIKNCKNLKKLFLVHGEESVLYDFSQTILKEMPNLETIIPNLGENFKI